MTPDELAIELTAWVGHVHLATSTDGWHCFAYTIRTPDGDDVELPCGDGATLAEALKAVLAQVG